jgi:ABC-type transport system involved in multi-copper enzyme maturation permease subunit
VIRLVSAEMLKLRTTRATKVLALCLAGLVVLFVVLAVLKAHVDDVDTAHDQQGLLNIGILVPLFGLLVGLLISTGEFRHQTITPTLLATPQRLRVVGAKLLAAAAVGAVAALLIQALIILLEVICLAARSLPVKIFDDSGVWKSVATVVVGAALWSALGAGIGTALRNQAATLVGAIIWVLVVENVVQHFFPSVGKLLPTSAMGAFVTRSAGDEHTYAMWPSLAITVGWVALFGLVAWQLLERRDVS